LQGFAVVDGPTGLEVFRAYRDKINCVILDLTMRRMGGEEVFRELRRLRSDVCVILSNGCNEQNVTQRFVGKELAGFIQKPYTAAKLREILKLVLG
jgi:two-component system, cell cycle sensor histidine kinase and response regulator CckA